MDAQEHWENVYQNKDSRSVSWYADHVESSLARIRSLGLQPDARILDLGGGASTLVDDLLKLGYSGISVLDISPTALSIAKTRLGERASEVNWIAANALEHDFGSAAYDLWHDRAVFHFLTAPSDRQLYRDKASKAMKPGGFLFLNVFADDGPEKCSGLVISRHTERDLEEFFGEAFDPVMHDRFVHKTPAGSDQRFVSVLLRRKHGPG
jgi:SAM-dependent methyltransferase